MRQELSSLRIRGVCSPGPPGAQGAEGALKSRKNPLASEGRYTGCPSVRTGLGFWLRMGPACTSPLTGEGKSLLSKKHTQWEQKPRGRKELVVLGVGGEKKGLNPQPGV